MKTCFMNGKIFRELMDSGKFKRVLLTFHHGLGDSISFYHNVLPVIKAAYPDVEFFFETHMGQEEWFGRVNMNDDYDLVVPLKFPCAEWDMWSNQTKAEKCLELEFGFPNEIQQENYSTPKYGSPLVGVHFVSTSRQGICYEPVDAKMLWDKIRVSSLIPLDTHFIHPDATLIRYPYQFEYRNVADIEPSIPKLIGLLRSLSGFAGVSGGNFWTALCTLPPQTILYLETEFGAHKLTRLPVHHMRGYDNAVVEAWLNDVKTYKERENVNT